MRNSAAVSVPTATTGLVDWIMTDAPVSLAAAGG
jgi:hypothetical protein